MAEGFEVGRAFIRISPDLDDFPEELRSKVEEATAGAEGRVKVGGDDAELQAVLDDAKAKLDELDGKDVTARLRADTADLDAKADDATARLRKLGDTEAEPVVTLGKEEFDEGADAVTEKLTVLGDTRADPVVGVDDEPAQESLAELQRQLAVLKAQKAGIDVDADASQADVKIAQVQAQVDALRNERAVAALGLDGSEFDAGAEAATEKLTVLGAEKAEPRLDLDDAEFNEKLDADKAKLSSAGSESGRAGLFSAIGLGIGGLTPGIGGAVAGLGLLGVTGGLAFGGIASALSDAHQAAQNTGQTSQQLAAQNFSNAVQVQQAQQSVTQARQQAAQNAVTSDQQIQQADMNLAETQRNTAASQVQAMEQVQQAQQGVQSATYSLSEANYSLGQAYEQAREQIIQLNDQLADSKLSVQAASLAVQQAEQQELQVNSSAYSTDLDRQQATLAVAQAKQQLQDATDKEADSQTAANQANAQGVDGSQTVIQAKQSQLTATQQLANAQQSLKDANTSLTNTQLNNETQLKEAQMQASSAREQAAYQQQQDAQAVAQAEQNLTNTIKEQQLQAAATASTENQAANQFAKDMAKLTPAGREVVNQLLGMRGAFRGLEADAQNAALPGFSVLLRGISAVLPEVGAGVTGMGTAIGQMAAGLGRVLQTQSAVGVINGLFRNGIQFMDIVGPAIGRMLGAIFTVGSKQGAVSGLADLIKGAADGIAGFAQGITRYIPQLDAFFEAVGKILKAMGPNLANEIGIIATVLSPLANLLNSKWGGPFVQGIAQILASLITLRAMSKLLPGQLGEYFGAIPGKIASLAVAPLKQMFAGMAAEAAESTEEAGVSFGTFAAGVGAKLAQASRSVMAWIAENSAAAATYITENIAMAASATAAFIAENAASLGLIAGIGLLVTAIVYLATHWKQVWSDVKNWAEDAWNFIYNGFGKYLLPLLGPAGMIALGVIELSKHWKQVWGDIKTAASDVWGWLKTGAEAVVSAVSGTWNRLESVFKTPVNFLIQHVYDDGIAKLWNDVMGAVHLKSLKLPIIQQLAGGGVLPGYAPGRDTVPALLSPGEAVLTPGATRAIGGAPTVNALNSAHAPSSGSRAPGHYAFGGIGSLLGGLVSGGEAVAKAVAALATGNTTAFVNALSGAIGTSAAGDLGQVMVAMPKTLLTDAAKAAIGMMGGGSSGGGGTVTSQVASWFAAAVKAAGVPASWIPDLETIAQHESSLNVSAINLTDSNAAAGNNSRGLMQVVPTTFSQYHVAGTSDNIFDPVANIAAAARYIGADYGTVANVPGIVSLAKGGPYVGYDSGGVLPPGMTAAVNMTGKPEAVLTADESAAVKAVLRQIAQGGAPGGTAGAPTVTQIFNGPQMPSHEQLAEMERRLSLTLSGA